MPKLDDPFVCLDAPEPEDFSPIPDGTELLAVVVESDLKVNGKGWQGVKAVFEVLEDGQYKGRKIFGQYTIKNPGSDKAVEIGQRQLRQLCEAMELSTLPQTEDLHDKPVIIKVGVEINNTNGSKYNVPRTAKPAGAFKKTAPVMAAKTPPSTGSKKPWE